MTTFERIKLPYRLHELEPIIDNKTMHYHYEILHKNYKEKLEKTLLGTTIIKQFPSLEKLMNNLENLPVEIKEDVRFFGGGLINHNLYFLHLTPMSLDKNGKSKQEKKISSELLEAIEKEFTSLENLKKELTKNALGVRGSGWTWLVLDKNNQLQIINTANQDGPWSLQLKPLIAIDIWEHAYYLYYGANREEYVKKTLNYILNWDYISKLYFQYTS